MLPYLSEFIGTAMLVLLGDGVVSNVSLNKSNMKGAGSIQITFAWGLAVMMPACIFGAASGAHFNPALTIALAVAGSFKWSMVPGYIAVQMLGAVLGACLVYLFFKDQFDATEDAKTKLCCFCTSPAVRNLPLNFICEGIATFVLVFSILGFGNVGGASSVGLNNIFVFGLLVSIGMSFGGVTGYAINPARDVGPRIAHAFLPIKNKGDSDWGYVIVPIAGPIVGGVLAALLFKVIPWA